MSTKAYRRQAQSLLEITFSRLSCAIIGIIFRQQNHNFTLAFRQLSTINETGDSDQFNIKVFIKKDRLKKQFDITDETLLVEIVILLQPLLVRPRHQVQAGRAFPVSDTKKKKSDSQPMSKKAEEEKENVSRKSTAAFKTILVSPGKIGLTLNVNTIKGGASITRIDTECHLIGQVNVGDVIVSIDGARITSIDDFQVNADKVRRFGIVPKNNKNGAPLDPPSSVVGGVSAAAVASTVTNSNTGVDPPPTIMPAAVANIFSQPKMDIPLEALLRRREAKDIPMKQGNPPPAQLFAPPRRQAECARRPLPAAAIAAAVEKGIINEEEIQNILQSPPDTKQKGSKPAPAAANPPRQLPQPQRVNRPLPADMAFDALPLRQDIPLGQGTPPPARLFAPRRHRHQVQAGRAFPRSPTDIAIEALRRRREVEDIPMRQGNPPPARLFTPPHRQAQAELAHRPLPAAAAAADIAFEALPLRRRGAQDIPMRQDNPPPARRFINARRQAQAHRTLRELFVRLVAVHVILRSLNVAFAAHGMNIFFRGIMDDIIVLAVCIIFYTFKL